ncbi:MAG TPA: imidazolonepropionase [Terriglobales bacterium]|jgi:imidazolonepropionase|nr:imidazolonepropionase [Terriglobales bacterium]
MRRLSALLLVDIGQLLTLRSAADGPRRGASLSELGIIQDAAVLCLGGKIVSVGTTKDALRDPWLKKNRKKVIEIDCRGRVVLPGFVDSHTHPVFTHPRLVDFEQRISGANYEEIAEAGGGIRSSIDGVRKASKTALAEKVSEVLADLARHGTTTVEAKSGYGLNLESELKSLEAIRAASREWPGTVIPTFLGAHVVPPEYRGRSREYVDLVCNEMIPAVAKRKVAQFVDVFCDRGAFSAAETARVFTAAEECGLAVRAHLGQLNETRLGPLLRYRPASLDHMDHVNHADLPVLAQTDTVATFVPGANYFLGLSTYPDARRFIESGVAVALATDYNPGSSPTLSMPMAMSLACTHMKMSPAEAIAATTINGAWALRLAGRKGSVEAGKDADLAVFNVSDYREIPYWFGANRCALTIVTGVPSSHIS